MADPADLNEYEGQFLHGTEPVTRLPFGVSRAYAALSRTEDPRADPIAAQYIPTEQELVTLPYESTDPIGDTRYQVTERLVRHYNDRALLLVSDRCATYCRFCFRRHFTGHGGGRLSEKQLDDACQFLSRTPEVREILLSGGDPLMLSDRDLEQVITRLKRVDPGYIIRICTRMPVVLPSRVTSDLAHLLGSFPSVWMVIHANHPRELSAEFRPAGCGRSSAPASLSDQSVLLKGVNDDADTLEELFRGLVQSGVKPYYLFQGDLASGTSHFRVPLARGLQLMAELRKRLSGLAMPTYAVDLPGGGKVPVESALVRTDPDAYILRGPDGAEYRYPRENEERPTDLPR